VVDYSSLDKLVHRLALGSRMRAEVLHDVERGAFLRSAPVDEGRHVFVTGFARAGTTILMREIYGSAEFGSLTYADMPFVLAPNFWHRLSAKSRKAGVRAERAHGDGIEVDFHSPEALDEVYWRVFSGDDYILPDRLVPHSPDDELLAGYRDFIRLVLRRTGKTRYLSKNNNHLLRLNSLAKAFPDSIILIPVRDPRDHALSLLNQHKRFLDSDAFTRDYMGWLGHHEFGATHRPIAWDGAIAAGEAQSLHYWLSQWIAAHQRIDALDRVHKNIQLVPYQALMSDPGIWPAVARRIGIAPAPLKEIRFNADREPCLEIVEGAVIDEATELYRRLEQRARETLGSS
jgi:Sulfotransferase family